jgi:hypothetical protein
MVVLGVVYYCLLFVVFFLFKCMYAFNSINLINCIFPTKWCYYFVLLGYCSIIFLNIYWKSLIFFFGIFALYNIFSFLFAFNPLFIFSHPIPVLCSAFYGLLFVFHSVYIKKSKFEFPHSMKMAFFGILFVIPSSYSFRRHFF